MPRPKVLIVEDEEILRAGMRMFLADNGYEIAEAGDCRTAEQLFRSHRPDLVTVDYLLPDGNALDLIPRFREQDPGVQLVVLTGHGTIDVAVRAVKEGADQFLTKPIEFPSLLVVIERALENQRNRRKVAAIRSGQARRTIDPFLGESDAIRAVEVHARRVAASDSPVLILGETGTGKSVLARWIHENGPRANEAFVDFNCAGLSKELLDTELFGHMRGAFTGATGVKQGLLEVAHRGTIFLDEIGDMDLQVQPKLLKVLDEKRFRRVGSVTDRTVDIRLVAATHQDPERSVREKRFRSDLYFRISTIQLMLPRLGDRGDDVLVLTRAIAASIMGVSDPDAVAIAPDAARLLRGYSWPGNIRELRNVIERAVLFRDAAEGVAITARDLGLAGGHAPGRANEPEARPEALCSLVENERAHIVRVLAAVGRNVPEAARVLGVSRSALYEKIRKHGIVTTELAATGGRYER
jgi:DNA-binding NtrC family response regulator